MIKSRHQSQSFSSNENNSIPSYIFFLHKSMKWNRNEGWFWFWILFLFDHNLQFPIFVVFSIIVDVFSIWLCLHSDDINAKSKGEKLHWPTSHTFSGASVGNVTLTCKYWVEYRIPTILIYWKKPRLKLYIFDSIF